MKSESGKAEKRIENAVENVVKGERSLKLAKEIIRILRTDGPQSPYALMLKISESYDINLYSRIIYILKRLEQHKIVKKKRVRGLTSMKNVYEVM